MKKIGVALFILGMAMADSDWLIIPLLTIAVGVGFITLGKEGK